MTAPATEKAAPIPAEVLDRFERAAMAYERLGKMTRDDEKTRSLRKEIIAELADARRAVLALADRQEERIREDDRTPETVNALEGLFWLELREPGLVPQRKGPWPHARTKEILREFMKVNPTAYISVVTMSHDGPWFADAPETLGIVDGRCWPTARKHIASSSAAHAGQRGDAS